MTDQDRTAGRPRNSKTGPALLAAARRLVLEQGYDAVSIGMIAAEAGVGRQTLYRRWPSKAELILDAFFESVSRFDAQTDLPVEAAMTTFLENLFKNLEVDGPAIRHLIASAQSNAQFLAVFKQNFTRPRAEIAKTILIKGIENNEIADTADIDTAIEALHGAFWYRLLQDEPLDGVFARRLARLVTAACKTGACKAGACKAGSA